jgi:tRNA A-37 threonylcarbamoyl transferase component Bud32
VSTMKTVFQKLGPYEILQVIGHGMAGSVFLARDTRTDRRVALKVVPHGAEAEAVEIINAERSGAELQRQLSRVSSLVPTVYEHGDHESGYFVAMEYLDGENLSARISRGPLPVEEVVHVGIQLCLFLEEAYRFETVVGDRELRSLVHGDLTPRNIRITSNRDVKVLDFGIAKALSLSRKATRNDFGTLWYLSPERLESGVVDVYSDLWALGVMLYEMVRGSRPFHAEDTRRLEKLILSRQSAPPLRGVCPAGLEAVIAKLLASTPAERYSSAQTIREDLARFKAGETTKAEAEGWPRVAPQEPATRRTQQPANGPAKLEDEKTRRTSAPARPVRTRQRSGLEIKIRRTVLAALIAFTLIVAVTDIRVGMDAADLRQGVAHLELDPLNGAWDRYEELVRRAYLPIGTFGLANALVDRTTELSERVMANYREPAPTVREAQWQALRKALARAVTAEPGDKHLRAALRNTEGHLHRINGEARRARREMTAAQRDLTEAVVAFRQAAQLRPDWPDPFLGLARTFIYGLQDVDRGADALRQADRRGYKSGERETMQLADGYRVRGDTLARNAKELYGLPQEKDYLRRAAEAYDEALTLYSNSKDFSKLSANIRATQLAIDRVEKRLSELSSSGGAPLPLPFNETP